MRNSGALFKQACIEYSNSDYCIPLVSYA